MSVVKSRHDRFKSYASTAIIVCVLGILLLIFSVKIEQFFTAESNEQQDKLESNRDLALESRGIQNDYRNDTIDYLVNLTQMVAHQNTIIMEQNTKIESLEQKIENQVVQTIN